MPPAPWKAHWRCPRQSPEGRGGPGYRTSHPQGVGRRPELPHRVGSCLQEILCTSPSQPKTGYRFYSPRTQPRVSLACSSSLATRGHAPGCRLRGPRWWQRRSTPSSTSSTPKKNSSRGCCFRRACRQGEYAPDAKVCTDLAVLVCQRLGRVLPKY